MILLLPSEVLVSICLMFTGLLGVDAAEGVLLGDLLGVAGDLVGVEGGWGATDSETLGATGSATLGFFFITSDGFSNTTADAGVLFENDFP